MLGQQFLPHLSNIINRCFGLWASGRRWWLIVCRMCGPARAKSGAADVSDANRGSGGLFKSEASQQKGASGWPAQTLNQRLLIRAQNIAEVAKRDGASHAHGAAWRVCGVSSWRQRLRLSGLHIPSLKDWKLRLEDGTVPAQFSSDSSGGSLSCVLKDLTLAALHTQTRTHTRSYTASTHMLSKKEAADHVWSIKCLYTKAPSGVNTC